MTTWTTQELLARAFSFLAESEIQVHLLDAYSTMTLADWRTCSDREIAKRLGVSNRTVSEHRKNLESEGRILPRAKSTQSAEACQCEVCTSAIQAAPLNDLLYAPINEGDASFGALVESIREHGVLEPLVVSSDGYLLSGHRRHRAIQSIGTKRIPVRIRFDVSYADDRETFLKLLASYNRQRVKTTSEQLREEVVLMSQDSNDELLEFRRSSAMITSNDQVELRSRKRRCAIRDKMELRQAIIDVVNREKPNWPLSDRAIHYRLLNITGLLRNDKTRIPYENSAACYDDVTNMLTRLRLDGSIPFDAIADETRPVVIWDTHQCVGDFVRSECDSFLKTYWRSLQQSQPNWVELLVEKNTVANQLRQVAGKYTIPMTSGRGYSSLPPRKEMVDRFRKSGRQKLVVIVVSDFDPEGQDIPHSFGISLRDDFDVEPEQLCIVKAALTADQVQTLDLHEGQLSKETSSRYTRFVAKYGERAWELESLSSEQLRQIVEASIRSVLDLESFDREVAQERNEKHKLIAIRQRLTDMLINDVDELN